MKNIFVIIGLLIFGSASAGSNAVRNTTLAARFISPYQDTVQSGWTKADTWTGMSNNKKSFYKLNPKSLTVYTSVNAKTWVAVVGGTWVDKNGSWIKILNKKLVSSSDNGKTWTEISDGQWQDADGDWCKFGSDWSLWVKKGS